jgi:hypothetical protein
VCGDTEPCVPTTCAALGFTCGPAGDQCGGQLNCGSCAGSETCGGGGQPSVCGGGGDDAGSSGGGDGGSGQIPTTLGWYDIPNTKFESVQQTSWSQIVAGNPANVMAAWGGGAYDSNRNRLYIWGGGHVDYKGNEVYALDLNANPISPLLLNQPNQYVPGNSCYSSQPGSNPPAPSSRHTYESLAYLPTQDLMFNLSGSVVDNGCFADDSWSFSPGTRSWTANNANVTNWQNGVPICDYDQNASVVHCFNNETGSVFDYTPTNNTFTENSPETGDGFPDLDMSGVVDYDGKRFYLVGGNWMAYYDLGNAPPYPARTDMTIPSSCTTFASGHYPGLQYDPVQKVLAMWMGGNTVYTYNPATNSCSSVTNSGGPPNAVTPGNSGQQANGTHGRFKYIPVLGVFVVCNDWTVDCYSLRLDSAADASFSYRVHQPGVLNSQDFDSATIYSTTVNQTPGSLADGFSVANEPNIHRDTTTFVSGGASANFFIPASSGENDTGNYWSYFGQGAANQTFGQNSTFYVQFAFRADANWTSTDWTQYGASGDNTAPKIVIFHNDIAGSCAEEEITTHDHDAWDMPTVYTDCGGVSAYTAGDGINYDENGTPLLLQQGFTVATPFTGYDCAYNNGNTPTGPSCFFWQPNTWYTMYYKVTVGTWGSANSTLEAWVAPYGQQMRKWLNVHNYTLQTDDNCGPSGTSACPGWNTLELTQFMTDKGTGNSNNSPSANVWYDELIISSKPIPSSCLIGCQQP